MVICLSARDCRPLQGVNRYESKMINVSFQVNVFLLKCEPKLFFKPKSFVFLNPEVLIAMQLNLVGKTLKDLRHISLDQIDSLLVNESPSMEKTREQRQKINS